jgi:hypothetical protein
MKMHVEVDLTPEEARKLMGLPDVSALQEKMLAEMERRMKAALDTSDPEAMLKAWMPPGAQLGGQAFEQFQRFLWDSARAATGGAAKGGPAKKDTKA